MFKKSVMKSVVLSVSLIHALPAISAEMNPALSTRPIGVMQSLEIQARGGDFGAGNGGDGLELGNSDIDGDVVVPVPGDILEAGELQISGTPGAEQVDKYLLRSCKTDSSGKPVPFGCNEEFKFQRLNESVRLTPGLYFVNYSGVPKFITIRANEKLTLKLKKLQVAKATRSVDFNVFIDFTAAEMQTLFAQIVSLSSESASVLADYQDACRSLSDAEGVIQDPNKAKICTDINAGDLTSTFKFLPDGTGQTLVTDLKTYDKPEYATVTGSKAGQFVSVLPGVYGIQFTDKQTGKTGLQLGIRVE